MCLTNRGLAPAVVVCCALLGAILMTSADARGQGCIASRAGASVPCGDHEFMLSTEELDTTGGTTVPPGVQEPPSRFSLAFSYRYGLSDRHFTGDHEDKERQEEHSEVINDSHYFDLDLAYQFTPRFSLGLNIPWSAHERSQTVRNTTLPDRPIISRYETQSYGLGDIRLIGRYWLLDPVAHPRWNAQVGVGIDTPTGEESAQDTFQVFDPVTQQIVARKRNVDQSIQPGDGGWGLILELSGYYRLVDRWTLYGQGAYMITPEETNGVATNRSNPFEAEMSIADTYMARGGVSYMVWPKYQVVLSLGGRVEGVPVHDLIGGSDGFRRPGLVASVEPGIAATIRGWNFGMSVPIAVYRNRQQSVPDKQLEDATGIPRHGDAAFADYVFMFTVSPKL